MFKRHEVVGHESHLLADVQLRCMGCVPSPHGDVLKGWTWLDLLLDCGAHASIVEDTNLNSGERTITGKGCSWEHPQNSDYCALGGRCVVVTHMLARQHEGEKRPDLTWSEPGLTDTGELVLRRRWEQIRIDSKAKI